MNLIPILVGAFGRKWRRRKNVNLALNNIPLPFFALASVWPPEAGGVRAAGREKRGGAKERKRNEIKRHAYDKIEKRDGQYKDDGTSEGMRSGGRREVGGNNEGGRGRSEERDAESRRITGNELYYAPFTCKREEETAVMPKRRDK